MNNPTENSVMVITKLVKIFCPVAPFILLCLMVEYPCYQHILPEDDDGGRDGLLGVVVEGDVDSH
jgi:hypothetical protein